MADGARGGGDGPGGGVLSTISGWAVPAAVLLLAPGAALRWALRRRVASAWMPPALDLIADPAPGTPGRVLVAFRPRGPRMPVHVVGEVRLVRRTRNPGEEETTEVLFETLVDQTGSGCLELGVDPPPGLAWEPTAPASRVSSAWQVRLTGSAPGRPPLLLGAALSTAGSRAALPPAEAAPHRARTGSVLLAGARSATSQTPYAALYAAGVTAAEVEEMDRLLSAQVDAYRRRSLWLQDGPGTLKDQLMTRGRQNYLAGRRQGLSHGRIIADIVAETRSPTPAPTSGC